MGKRREKKYTEEELDQLTEREAHDLLWQQANKVEANKQRGLAILAYMREKFGDAKIREMAEDPDPENDGLRSMLETEREEAEKRIRN
jgi:hypothetical protein